VAAAWVAWVVWISKSNRVQRSKEKERSGSDAGPSALAMCVEDFRPIPAEKHE